jgi:hypothetical protein
MRQHLCLGWSFSTRTSPSAVSCPPSFHTIGSRIKQPMSGFASLGTHAIQDFDLASFHWICVDCTLNFSFCRDALDVEEHEAKANLQPAFPFCQQIVCQI